MSLGLASDCLTSRGLDVEALRSYRLGVVETPAVGHEHAVGRLSIPYLTPTGVVAMKFRCMADSHGDHKGSSCPKYLYNTGDTPTLYNVGVLSRDIDRVVITEGELDALAVETLAGLAAVGYPGVSVWSKHRYWARCFAGIPSVFVIADGDKPGRDSANMIAQDIPSSRVIRMPDGHDANSFLAQFGWEAFYSKLGIDCG